MTMAEFVKKWGTRSPRLIISDLVNNTQDARLKSIGLELGTELEEALSTFVIEGK